MWSTRVSVLQFSSSGSPRVPPTTGMLNSSVWQMNGSSCGPENSGPSPGWLVTCTEVAHFSLGGVAVISCSPTSKPSTTPSSTRRSASQVKSSVTSSPSRVTVMRWGGICLGAVTSTSTSPPVTMSGALETVSISSPPGLPWVSAPLPVTAPVPATRDRVAAATRILRLLIAMVFLS